jgi:CHAT domain-containing protein
MSTRLFFALACSIQLAVAASTPALRPGKLLRKSLVGGQTHSYSITAAKGDYIHVEAKADGVDVSLVVYSAEGKKSVWWDNAFLIANADTRYRVEVAPDNPKAKRGHYRLRLERRPATEVDVQRVLAEQLCILAGAALARSKSDEALGYWHQALPLFRELKDARREAETLWQSASTLMDAFRFAEAEPEIEASVAIYRRLGDRAEEAAMLARQGVNLRLMNQFDKSRDALEESLKIRRNLRDKAALAESLDRLGITWSAQDRADRAVECYREALGIVRTLHGDPMELVRELNNISVAYAALGQNDKAAASLEEALPTVRRIGNKEREAVVLSDLGGVSINLKQYARAVRVLEQALAIQEALKQPNSQTLANLGSAYQRLGQTDKAIASLNRALPVARAQKERRNEGAILNLLGRTYRSAGQYDAAVAYYEQGRAILRQVQSPEFESISLSGLMLCWKGKGQPAIAIFYGKQSVNLLQGLRFQMRSMQLELRESFLKGNEEPYHDLAELLIAAGRLPEAEYVMDLLKEQEYRDFVRRAADAGEVRRAALTPAEAEWARRDDVLSDRIVAIGAERGTLLARPNLNPQERQRLESLDRDIEAANREFQRYVETLVQTDASRTRLEQLREGQGMMEDLRDLPAGTVAIYTLVTERKYVAILITSEIEKAYESAIPAVDLNRKILEFRELVEHPDLDVRPMAKELYGILLGPMAADLLQAKAQTIMWSLDGCLRYLPLAALYDGEKYLLEQYRLSVFTPASNARLKDKPSARWQALGLGMTKGALGAPPLPEVASELKGIIAQQAGGGVLPGEIVLDEQFTEQAMRAELRKRFAVVHIASHFHFEPGDESGSFLLLGDGSRFTLADLKSQTNLFGGVQLLTLSACSTGLSDAGGDGKEVEGFGVLAQREGARAVVASLWSVADVSTSLMMQRFYRLRQEDESASKLEALRQAQLELLHGELGGGNRAARRALIHDPGRTSAVKVPQAPKFAPDAKAPFAHPYYWAAFYLMGNWL